MPEVASVTCMSASVPSGRTATTAMLPSAVPEGWPPVKRVCVVTVTGPGAGASIIRTSIVFASGLAGAATLPHGANPNNASRETPMVPTYHRASTCHTCER